LQKQWILYRIFWFSDATYTGKTASYPKIPATYTVLLRHARFYRQFAYPFTAGTQHRGSAKDSAFKILIRLSVPAGSN
jgi:hypothetical protein